MKVDTYTVVTFVFLMAWQLASFILLTGAVGMMRGHRHGDRKNIVVFKRDAKGRFQSLRKHKKNEE